MKNKFAAFAFLAAIALTGCGKVTPSAEVPQTTTAAATEAADPYADLKLIGKESEEDNVYKFTLENKTDKDIVSLTVKSDIQDKFSDNMIDSKDPFIKNEKRLMYFVPEKQESTKSEDGHVSAMGYTIKLEFADKKTAELHQFPFKEMEDAELCIEDNVAYIKYTAKGTNEKVNTKENEKMYAENEPATEAKTEAETTAPAEADNNNEASYEPVQSYDEPDYSQQTYEPEPDYTPAPSYTPEPNNEPAPQATQAAAEPEPATTAKANGGCTANSTLWD